MSAGVSRFHRSIEDASAGRQESKIILWCCWTNESPRWHAHIASTKLAAVRPSIFLNQALTFNIGLAAPLSAVSATGRIVNVFWSVGGPDAGPQGHNPESANDSTELGQH